MAEKRTDEELINYFVKTLKTIDRRAKTTYRARPGHDEDVAMIGMIAENAILEVDPNYAYKPETK